jgi:uncharacterized protein
VTGSSGSVLWRRLDTPGHDACSLSSLAGSGGDQRASGWQLEGAAAFRHDGEPAWLAYRVACDADWSTREGHVRGWLGTRPVEFTIVRPVQGDWTLNGEAVAGLGHLVDLDFGFTPATNLPQLRRVALAEGRAEDVPVAWLDVSAGTLTQLPQRYERRAGGAYWYESPSTGYAALLEIDAIGFVRAYPQLWEAES